MPKMTPAYDPKILERQLWMSHLTRSLRVGNKFEIQNPLITSCILCLIVSIGFIIGVFYYALRYNSNVDYWNTILVGFLVCFAFQIGVMTGMYVYFTFPPSAPFEEIQN